MPILSIMRGLWRTQVHGSGGLIESLFHETVPYVRIGIVVPEIGVLPRVGIKVKKFAGLVSVVCHELVLRVPDHRSVASHEVATWRRPVKSVVVLGSHRVAMVIQGRGTRQQGSE